MKDGESTTTESPGPKGVDNTEVPIGTIVPFGRTSEISLTAASAATLPRFATRMERLTISPSTGRVGIVTAGSGARSGTPPGVGPVTGGTGIPIVSVLASPSVGAGVRLPTSVSNV